ncbi:MAG: fumarylacetoacetate hydrolase family protein [Edaphobacter sp.]|uniref:fumarylacetoacetate hydrolase family protein n=1 Tax=Edaphobacter sp. TaxID=1934404 RepID=UPI0023928441|nr:fumarylacetoacetate hydrolase family protein [Edaphobacter sp.]MDE1175103.1 fumarylacetoacetate hydrolase family protein [Edaphobacter sp.]
MKLVTFSKKGAAEKFPGALVGQDVANLSALGFASVLAIIEGGDKALAAVIAGLEKAPRVPLAEVQLDAPVRPPRVFGIGLNYARHAAESKMAVQKVPTVFMKLTSSVVGPDTPVILPKISLQPDYEAEFGVVVGKGGYQIPASDWKEHIFGYTIVNDVSARDIQLATSQWTLGKSFPTFTPIGPAVVTADEIADPHALPISLTIDGETLQSSNTSDLIFKIPALIEYLSSLTPLQAGDVISTGTPEGVGMGRTPQRWLKPNEEMIVTIEGLGSLRNRTVAE